MLGACSDFRTPFKLMLMDEKLFFHPSFKKKRKGGRMWQPRSKEHMALHDLLSYLESVCKLLSLNKMEFVKLTQHTNFGREENSRLNKRAAVKYSSYWLSSPQSQPGKPLTRSIVEHAQDCSLSQHKLSVTSTVTLLQLKCCFAANYHTVKTRLNCISSSHCG